MTEKKFHIVTLVNDLQQYQEMKTTFIEKGFDESKCLYTVLDNSHENFYEPYSTFNKVKNETLEPYLIFCHQDLLMNQEHDYNHLLKTLRELDTIDSNWAVAGNAGTDKYYVHCCRLTDVHSTGPSRHELPLKVHSLDENFLIIKNSTSICNSSELSGFHFYAPDLCLNAIINGYSCYVIDFHLTHLSGGSMNDDYWKMKDKFHQRWIKEFYFCYVTTTTTYFPIGLSKYKWIDSCLNHVFTQRIFRLISQSKLAKLNCIFEPYFQRNIINKIMERSN